MSTDTESLSAALWKNARIHQCVLPDAAEINQRILEAFDALPEEGFDRRSHFFGGRYENLYLARERMPALEAVLDYALACAGRILARPPDTLRCGFWFNAMGPDQLTTEHTHDENDELLSAVYYVTVPESSGDLILYNGPLTIRVEPEPGTLLFFPPDLPHAVEVNRSGLPRMSIGMNFGPISDGL